MIGLARALRLRHPSSWLAVVATLVIVAFVGLHGRSYYVISRRMAAGPGRRPQHTAVVAQIYPLAAAVESRGVPTWSPHRGYGYFEPPPAAATDVVWLGFEPPDALRTHFTSCTQMSDGERQMWRCTGRLDGWGAIWPGLRTR